MKPKKREDLEGVFAGMDLCVMLVLIIDGRANRPEKSWDTRCSVYR